MKLFCKNTESIRKILLFIFFFSAFVSLKAQFTYGTTGLMNMPTADMQKDKTFMFGGGYLEKHASTGRWFYDTWNYFVNITFFPWMEFAYTLNLHKAVVKDPALPGGYWVPYTYGKFINQDRSFHIRFRLWKEGWWKEWTPQIVIGSNDVIGDSWNGGSLSNPTTYKGNGFLNRYYIAATKHVEFTHMGDLGAHLSWVYNKRPEYKLNGLCVGANFRFKLKEDGTIWRRAVNGLNVMAEAYPADGQGVFYNAQLDGKNHKTYDRGVHIGKYDINIGACYSLWKDRINLYGELYGCKDFSGGIQFKVHL